jgi:hypothetical protein
MLVTRYAYARACACTHAHARVDTLATCVRIPCSSAVYAPPHPLHIQTHTDSMRVLTYVYCVLCVCGGGGGTEAPDHPVLGVAVVGYASAKRSVMNVYNNDGCLVRWIGVPLVLSSPVCLLSSLLQCLPVPLSPLLSFLSLSRSALFSVLCLCLFLVICLQGSHMHTRAHTHTSIRAHKQPNTHTHTHTHSGG